MLDNKTLKVYTYIIRQGKALKTRKGTNMRETKNLWEQEIFRRNESVFQMLM